MAINELFELVRNRDIEALQSRVGEHTLAVEQEIIALQAQGADINPQDSETSFTLLHLITLGFLQNDLLKHFDAHHIINVRYPLLYAAAECGNIIAIEWLLGKGEDVNIQNTFDMGTSLHRAVEFGQVEAAKVLLNNYVDVNIKNAEGRIALWEVFLHMEETVTDDIRIKILKLLIQHGSNVNDVDNDGGTLIEFPLFTIDLFQEQTTKDKALLLLMSTRDIDICLDNQQIFSYFIVQDNVNQLFAIKSYEKQKIAAGYNLHKALIEYGQVNQNQVALNTATYVNQIALNNTADLLQLAVNVKPHVAIHDIEQSDNIGFLRDNELKCIKLKELDTRLKGLDIQLDGVLDQHSPFYEFSNSLSHAQEAELATLRRITEVFTKNLKLPGLPEEQSLQEALETTTDQDEAHLIIQKLQAPGMKEVFNKGDIMHSICSFLDPQSASNFSYTNKNPNKTLIKFPD